MSVLLGQQMPYLKNKAMANSNSNNNNKLNQFSQPGLAHPVSRLALHWVEAQAQGLAQQPVAMVGAGAAALPLSSMCRDICPEMQILPILFTMLPLALSSRMLA